MKRLVRHGLQLLVFGVLLGLDQWTKCLVFNANQSGCVAPFWQLGGVFEIVKWCNYGAAFGMFQGGGWFFFTVAIIATVTIAFILAKDYFKHPWGKWGVVLIAAGAMGNAIDRVTYGCVVDMIRLTFIDFPIFNLADIFITAGAIMMMIYLLFYYDKEHGKKD